MIPHEQLRAIAETDDFVTHDGLMQRLDGHAGICYYKRDFVLRGGHWRGRNIRGALASAGSARFSTVVVGHSDYSFSPITWTLLRTAGVKWALATNATTTSKRVQPLPLGLTNDCDDGPLHRLLGDRTPLRKVVAEGREKSSYTGIIYANFNPGTHRSREALHRLLGEVTTSLVSTPDYSVAGRSAYLRGLRDADFVLCPRGNGIDTHRLWETLYVGGLPIVEEFPRCRDLLDGLPVVVVPNWSKISDAKFMERSWHEMHEAMHHSERLTLSFYVNLAVKMTG
jgi:hypothetical protein